MATQPTLFTPPVNWLTPRKLSLQPDDSDIDKIMGMFGGNSLGAPQPGQAPAPAPTPTPTSPTNTMGSNPEMYGAHDQIKSQAAQPQDMAGAMTHAADLAAKQDAANLAFKQRLLLSQHETNLSPGSKWTDLFPTNPDGSARTNPDGSKHSAVVPWTGPSTAEKPHPGSEPMFTPPQGLNFHVGIPEGSPNNTPAQNAELRTNPMAGQNYYTDQRGVPVGMTGAGKPGDLAAHDLGASPEGGTGMTPFGRVGVNYPPQIQQQSSMSLPAPHGIVSTSTPTPTPSAFPLPTDFGAPGAPGTPKPPGPFGASANPRPGFSFGTLPPGVR